MNILVIRTKNVDKMKSTFEQLGLQFKQEQHGNGPIHFALEKNNIIFEIYPSTEIEDWRFI